MDSSPASGRVRGAKAKVSPEERQQDVRCGTHSGGTGKAETPYSITEYYITEQGYCQYRASIPIAGSHYCRKPLRLSFLTSFFPRCPHPSVSLYSLASPVPLRPRLLPDLQAVHDHAARGGDAEADTVAVDFNHSDFDLADHDGLAEFTGEFLG